MKLRTPKLLAAVLVGAASLWTQAVNAQTFCNSGCRYVPVAPCRVVDTRYSGYASPDGPPGIGANTAYPRTFLIRGRCGVPTGANGSASVRAVALTATIPAPVAPGYLALWPSTTPCPPVPGGLCPPASILNFIGGESAVSNGAVVALGTTTVGSPDLAAVVGGNGGTANLVLDVLGYYTDNTAGLSLSPIPGPIVIGSSLTLNGTGFPPTSVVKMSVNTSAGVVDVSGGAGWRPSQVSQTQLTVFVPPDVPLGLGTASVYVMNGTTYAVSNVVTQLIYGNPAVSVPTITTINEAPIDPANPGIPGAHVRTVILPGSNVVLAGSGFVGPLVNLTTAAGSVGPLTPVASSASSITVTVPNNATTQSGPATFQVVNVGAGSSVSQMVDAVLGAPITVTSVSMGKYSVIVDGTGFCSKTVVNLWANTASGVQNLGGLDGSGNPRIPITLVSPNQITFTRPTAALAGNASLQAINPPNTPFATSEVVTFVFP